MHFSVPDTQELIDESGCAYLGYNIHINGLFHCTVRYKQLHSLHEQLTRELTDVTLPIFPPKKFFPLTAAQQEERRLMLDKYIQAIGQNTNINNSELLNGFLMQAQLETANSVASCDKVIVYLSNGAKMEVNTRGMENSGQLLQASLRQLKLDEKFFQYFSLFVTYQEEKTYTVLRKLHNFESPILTQRGMKQFGTKIVLAKWYWDLKFDQDLIIDPVALELLCIQASGEIERGWISSDKEIRQQLKKLRDQDKKKEYLELARSMKYYGCAQFAPCVCDYPETGTKIRIAIGRNELNMRTKNAEGVEQEFSFKVTRMRCWRITTLHEGSEKYEDSLELSFEYLMAKDNLQWITVSSEQAILMSVCLQSMIDELLFKNVGGVKIREITNRPWTYVTRNGHNRTIQETDDQVHNNCQNSNNGSPIHQSRTEPIIKKFTEKLFIGKSKKALQQANTTVVTHENRLTSERDFLENNAFCMIGDDDL